MYKDKPKNNKKGYRFKLSLTQEQKKAKAEILQNDVSVIVGKAGSGKTLLACQIALQALLEKQVNRIVITRPTISKEDIGHLPGNIKEKDVINYLQNMDTVQSVPTEEGLYESIPNDVKERFNPDLKRLRKLSNIEKFDITNYDRGLKVANTRTDILDGLASQQNVRTIPTELQGFLENPSAVEVPEGVQQAAANIPAQTQAVYDALFPQDKLGSAIAGTQNA